jgi:hypothetical protein
MAEHPIQSKEIGAWNEYHTRPIVLPVCSLLDEIWYGSSLMDLWSNTISLKSTEWQSYFANVTNYISTATVHNAWLSFLIVFPPNIF